MKILLLGGTQFVGRHLVEMARAAGHELTLFHRGKTNPDLFPDVEHILGDRATDLDRLAGRHWDRVIDLCGYLPRIVSLSAEALRLHADHYTFISSISVYRDLDQTLEPLDEMCPVIELADPTVEVITGDTYGGLKALCETAARKGFDHTRVLIVRPGLIVGPYDHTDRFTYWCVRGTDGGRMAVPGSPGRHFPVIDVRDIVPWILSMVDRAASGVVNLGGPSHDGRRGDGSNDGGNDGRSGEGSGSGRGDLIGPPPAFEAMLAAIREATGTSAEPVWMSVETMARLGITPDDFPLWNQAPDGTEAGFDIDSDRAFGTGLTLRPLVDTVRDTLAWRGADLDERPLKVGPSREREAEILAALGVG